MTDIHLTVDARTNSLLVSAPKESLDLILTLIREMDAIRPLKAEIKIFPLKRGDAPTVLTTLQTLFQSRATTATGGAGGGGAGAAAGTTGQVQPLATDAPLIVVVLSSDTYSNSIIVAGSPRDVATVEAIILRLESSGFQSRRNEVYLLRNATAADVATPLTTYFTNSIAVYTTPALLPGAVNVDKQVVVVAEPITNKLLISASPGYFEEVMRIIRELDADIPQVLIQVLIAEVDLTGAEEFGIELGLQSPVVFQRSVYPPPGYTPNTYTTTFTNTTTANSPLPSGTALGGLTGIPVSVFGFNFNQPQFPLGNDIAVTPNVIGVSGLSSLGVGRVSPTTGLGGFVLSGGNDTFNFLLRALKTQGRLDVLSRPQVMTLDNQSARVFVGQNFPIVTGSTTTATGLVQASLTYEPVGVELLVTPKISPDGKVLMRVTPTVSSPQTTNIAVGQGIFAVAVNQETVDTTVIGMDGETVAIGGLIRRSDQKTENKVPWLGDLPVIGAAFRYRTQTKQKSELMVIMTPHIVRCRADADALFAMEAKRMDWVVGDIVRAHGLSGMEPMLPPPPPVDPRMNGAYPPGAACPPGVAPMQSPTPAPQQQLPAPTPLPVPMPTPAPQQQLQAPTPLPVPKPQVGGTQNEAAWQRSNWNGATPTAANRTTAQPLPSAPQTQVQQTYQGVPAQPTMAQQPVAQQLVQPYPQQQVQQPFAQPQVQQYPQQQVQQYPQQQVQPYPQQVQPYPQQQVQQYPQQQVQPYPQQQVQQPFVQPQVQQYPQQQVQQPLVQQPMQLQTLPAPVQQTYGQQQLIAPVIPATVPAPQPLPMTNDNKMLWLSNPGFAQPEVPQQQQNPARR